MNISKIAGSILALSLFAILFAPMVYASQQASDVAQSEPEWITSSEPEWILSSEPEWITGTQTPDVPRSEPEW